jgi:hypothetical protein
MGKGNVVHIHYEISFSHKRNASLSFLTVWMKLEMTLLSEISQAQKDRCHMVTVTCGI